MNQKKYLLKPHIEFNSEERNNARNDFEKDIFKLWKQCFKIHGDDREYKKCEGTTKNTVKRKFH